MFFLKHKKRGYIVKIDLSLFLPVRIFVKYLLLVCLILSACATQSTSQQSLYNRIGGKAMLYTISSETLDIIAKDPRTKRSFDGIKMTTLKESFTNFLCVETGGDCEYEGETMENSHADAEITRAEFELTVQALRDVLDANNIAIREKNELLKVLAPMKRDIVSGAS